MGSAPQSQAPAGATAGNRKAIDEVQIAGSTTPGANSKLSCQVRLGSGCEGRGLIVTQMYPLDLALTADCIGQPVQAVADDTIDPFHTATARISANWSATVLVMTMSLHAGTLGISRYDGCRWRQVNQFAIRFTHALEGDRRERTA